jgi:hypothetical protein
LNGNMVQASVMVTSPGAFGYFISDYSGRIVAKGAVAQGMTTISTGILSKGMYIIQFSNGQEEYNEKFMKQ